VPTLLLPKGGTPSFGEFFKRALKETSENYLSWTKGMVGNKLKRLNTLE